MQADQSMKAYADDDGVVVFDQIGNWSLQFLGASVNASVKPGAYFDTIALQMKKSERIAVVAIQASKTETRSTIHRGFLITLRWERMDKASPTANLKDPWMPRFERFGAITQSHLSVTIGDTDYTTNSLRKTEPKTRFVPDGNLLCRYLNGEATVDEVEAAASEYTEEISAREQLKEIDSQSYVLEQEMELIERGQTISERLNNIGAAWKEYRQLESDRIRTREEELRTASQAIGRLRMENTRLKVLLKTWWLYAADLYGKLGGKLFKGKLLKSWLCKFPHEILGETMKNVSDLPSEN